MPETQVLTKAAFSRHLGVSRARVSQYISMGLPCRPDGRLNLPAALRWVRENIALPIASRLRGNVVGRPGTAVGMNSVTVRRLWPPIAGCPTTSQARWCIYRRPRLKR